MNKFLRKNIGNKDKEKGTDAIGNKDEEKGMDATAAFFQPMKNTKKKRSERKHSAVALKCSKAVRRGPSGSGVRSV